jgi:hypothetical protein
VHGGYAYAVPAADPMRLASDMAATTMDNRHHIWFDVQDRIYEKISMIQNGWQAIAVALDSGQRSLNAGKGVE